MTDFEIMDKMAEQSMDITMCPDIVSCDKNKKGGTVKFGLPSPAFEKVINSLANVGREEYYVAMYIINKKQFDKIKAESK
jgi:hypothetical protein